MIKNISKIENFDDLLKIANFIYKIELSFSPETDTEYNINNSRILLKNFLYTQILNNKILLKQKNPKINLKNLLKRKYFKRKVLWQILDKYPNLNRNLGTVPFAFLENITDKKDCSIKIFNLLAKYSLILNYKFADDNIEQITIKSPIKDFETELSTLLNKKVIISLIGSGRLGNAFKLTILNKNKQYDFVYKVFFPHYEKRAKHGSIEVFLSYFANYNSRKNQFAKFYMGRMASSYKKDAFLLSEYVKPSNNIQRNKLNTDYLYCPEKHAGNSINGKIIDFGGLKENIPELADNRKLRKILKILSMHINCVFDDNILKYTWYLNNRDCKNLKSNILRYDINLFKKSLYILKKYNPLIPKKLINNLSNIENWNNNHEISETIQLKSRDIVFNNISKIKRCLYKFNLNIKSELNAGSHHFGHMIIDLKHDRQLIYIFNSEKHITEIKIEEYSNKQTHVLLDLKEHEFEQFNLTHNIEDVILI